MFFFIFLFPNKFLDKNYALMRRLISIEEFVYIRYILISINFFMCPRLILVKSIIWWLKLDVLSSSKVFGI